LLCVFSDISAVKKEKQKREQVALKKGKTTEYAEEARREQRKDGLLYSS